MDDVAALEKLLETVEYVSGPDVDDVEDIIAGIVRHSDDYKRALERAIKALSKGKS